VRFGYEWEKYHYLFPDYENQFLQWIEPLSPSSFKDKNVLDAGCGMGRNSLWALRYGAAHVTAFDYDERCVEAASRLLASHTNASVERRDIYEIDYENQFDLVFSIGVIHHLENPSLALANLARALRPGGTLLVWLYGYESNEWVVRYINPIRQMTSRLPPPLTHAISYLFSVPLFLGLRLWRPRHEYLRQIRRYPFSHIHSIVFDHLLPRVAHYYKRREVEDLFNSLPLKEYSIYHNRSMSWTVIGNK
jgi:SAM-dependent methyltransferase